MDKINANEIPQMANAKVFKMAVLYFQITLKLVRCKNWKIYYEN